MQLQAGTALQQLKQVDCVAGCVALAQWLGRCKLVCPRWHPLACRVLPPGSWSLSEEGEGADDVGSPHSAASSGSDGGASMQTAASGSMAATERTAGGSPHSDAGGAAQPQRPREHQHQQPAAEPSGLTAAYTMLAGLIDDVMHIDGSTAAGDGAEGAGEDDGATAGGGTAAAAGAALGRPPRPPTAVQPIPLPSAGAAGGGSKSGSKKKKKKDRQRAAVGAKMIAAAGFVGSNGGGDDGSATDGDTDATSLADSGREACSTAWRPALS